MSNTYFVTRHPGALDWLRSVLPGEQDAIQVDHLGDVCLAAGDKVFGVVSLCMAARLCARGAAVYALTVDVPMDLRGLELSMEQLQKLGTRLVRYAVVELGESMPLVR